MIEAGAVKRVRIIACGALFHVEADTPTGTTTAHTLKGSVKTWSSLDSSAKWVRSLGIGMAQIDISQWQPGQRELGL
ncbi:MAG: hypothetical protein A2514_07510 [Gammaproteobacteria bacterium RIFOXYD12_FULL_61_37]|nr:MAG: hypothetical protein A2514_07510 [Gammaproteobacteria bacterium RIFOXYD12_FULL_61_37]